MAQPPKDKKKLKGFKEFDPTKYIDIEPTLDEAVGRNTAVITFGRMNPMTVGHEKLVSRVAMEASKRKGEPMVFLSHSSGAKSKTGKGSENKDPIVYDEKIKFASKAFGPIVKKSPLKTLFDIMRSLNGKFKNVVMVAGSDRVDEYTSMLQKYNGKEYNFDSIQVVSAGARDPDAEGTSGMSGTKMRGYAKNDDSINFAKGLPKNLQSSADEVMAAVRKGMNMSENSMIESENDTVIDEALNRMQRRKRGLAMRKARFKIKRGREKAAKRTASQDVLKKRAKKAALNIFKQKFAKNRRYAELSAGEKEIIDKRIEKISKKRIEGIARKLLPKVKQKERDRRKSMMSNKNEDINEASLKDTKTLKRPHQLMDANNKPKFDARFRMFKKKNVNENAEDLSLELAELIEATEQFNEAKLPHALDPNKSLKHARIDRGVDKDNDGDVDKFDKQNIPDEITGDEKINQTPKMMKKYAGEIKHTKKGNAYESAKAGLWANIHAKRKRIKDGSGEKMREPGSKGAPTDDNFKSASESVNEATFKVDIEGLPAMFIDAESAPQVKKTLRQMLKKPDDKIRGVDRVQPAEVKKHFRLKALGKEEEMDEECGAGEEGTNKLVKKYKKDTPSE